MGERGHIEIFFKARCFALYRLLQLKQSLWVSYTSHKALYQAETIFFSILVKSPNKEGKSNEN